MCPARCRVAYQPCVVAWSASSASLRAPSRSTISASSQVCGVAQDPADKSLPGQGRKIAAVVQVRVRQDYGAQALRRQRELLPVQPAQFPGALEHAAVQQDRRACRLHRELTASYSSLDTEERNSGCPSLRRRGTLPGTTGARQQRR